MWNKFNQVKINAVILFFYFEDHALHAFSIRFKTVLPQGFGNRIENNLKKISLRILILI